MNMAFKSDFYPNSEVLHKLTPFKISAILVISSLYNIFNMEEGGMLTSQIVNEYKGLKLENPPQIRGAHSEQNALELLGKQKFDLILIVPNLEDVDPFLLSGRIKERFPDIPIILVSQNKKQLTGLLEEDKTCGINHIYHWFGGPELLIAIIKTTEDYYNAEHDTVLANVRVVVLIEDATDFYSRLLPIIYKEIVNQIQSLIAVGLNDTQRALTLRARPKVLLAKSYEEGMALCEKFKPYLLCVASDTRLPKNGKIEAEAGIELLSHIKRQSPDLPLLLLSTEKVNRQKAQRKGFAFIDKNSTNIRKRIHDYFLEHLGFGDFIFRMPDGSKVSRVGNFQDLEFQLHQVPDESLAFHAERHHFSRWVLARLEISIALKFRSYQLHDFDTIQELRRFLISSVHSLRKHRQKGSISPFDKHKFDAEIRDFTKIGNGSLGGKARGLAFMSDFFRQNETLIDNYPGINIQIPNTLVISTAIFDKFAVKNNLRLLLKREHSDEEVMAQFLAATLSDEIIQNLRAYLKQVSYPLSVRSSSQMEDAQSQPYAGLYRTYMIPNNAEDLSVRLNQLVTAIKLVYASTYFSGAKLFSMSTSNQHSEESMAVIIQQLVGSQYGDYFYPAISGVAQSYNYYPFSQMRANEGVVHMALGFGKTVVGGEKCIRFSPLYPAKIPEFSRIDDILANAQRSFYALRTKDYPEDLRFNVNSNLEKRDVNDAIGEFPVDILSSTYVPSEDRVRDSSDMKGTRLITHAKILKYKLYDIPGLLHDLLRIGKKSFGCPIEIEFSVNLYPGTDRPADFYFLQIRPMMTNEGHRAIKIASKDLQNAFCYSTKALGNGVNKEMADIVYIKPDEFRTSITRDIAQEIDQINRRMDQENRSYILAGPGRWGGSDRWLGIPVKWRQISRVGAIIEFRNEKLNANPSEGSHFFQNITSLGIHYLMINETQQTSLEERQSEFFDWQWIYSQPVVSEMEYIRHIRLKKPMTLKMDGRTSRCVILKP